MSFLETCNADPIYDPTITPQTELIQLSDEELEKGYIHPPFRWYHRVFQVFCFLIFLGPIRVLLTILSFLIFGVALHLIRGFVHYFKLDLEIGKHLCLNLARFFFRSFAFGCGVFWIRFKGTFDPNARFCISNHCSLIDPFIILIKYNLTPVIRYEAYNVVFLRRIIESVDPVYVKRDSQRGQTSMLIERANNPIRFPVLVYPEGTISGGKFLLKFKTGCFLTKHDVQLSTIRYSMPFVPKNWAVYCWKQFSILEHFWLMISMPPTIATVEILSTVRNDFPEVPENIQETALKAQLIISKSLHLKAVQNDSRDIFRIEKKWKDEQLEKNKVE